MKTTSTTTNADVLPLMYQKRISTCIAKPVGNGFYSVSHSGKTSRIAANSAIDAMLHAMREDAFTPLNANSLVHLNMANINLISSDEDDKGDSPEDLEECICSYCDGTGEGQYDGTRCHACHGSGVVGE